MIDYCEPINEEYEFYLYYYVKIYEESEYEIPDLFEEENEEEFYCC